MNKDIKTDRYFRKKLNNKIIAKVGITDRQRIVTSVIALPLIWNFLRLVYLLISSFMLHQVTNVPFGLLIKRENFDITNMQLMFLTIVLFLSITSTTVINPLSEESRQKIVSFGDKIQYVVLMLLFLVICLYFFFFRKLSIVRGSYILQRLQTYLYYILPLFILLNALCFGREYLTCISENDVSSTVILKYEDIIDEIKKGNKDYWERQRLKQKINAIRKKFLTRIVPILVLNIVSILMLISVPTYCILDKHNRFIVADLGDKYIVQEAEYDEINEELYVDTSCYYIVEGIEEELTIHPLNSGEIRKMSIHENGTV